MAVRLLIVDDHTVVRQGLRMFLLSDPEIDVVGEARDGEEAIRLVHELRPEVVLMDLLMPHVDGIRATATVRREAPHTEVVALTSVVEDAAVTGALAAGAIGYVLKDTRAHELSRVIKAAAAGQVCLSVERLERLLREIETPDTPPATLAADDIKLLRQLTERRSNGEIAAALACREADVKQAVASLLQRLRVASRTQAILYAIRQDIVSAEQVLRAHAVEGGCPEDEHNDQ